MDDFTWGDIGSLLIKGSAVRLFQHPRPVTDVIFLQMAGKTFKINGMCPMCPYVFLGPAGSDAEDRAGRPPAFSIRNRLSDPLFLSSALQLWSVASSACCFLVFAFSDMYFTI
jgi:hypothetical protein